MKQRNIEIDCLRAFAIIMTIYVHTYLFFYPWNFSLVFHPFKPGATLGHLWVNSWTGVDLFLVISGYVISKTIVSGIDKLKLSYKSNLALFIKAFYVRRIFRIYPLAWLIFLCVLIASFIFNNNIFSTPENNLEAGVAIFTYTFNYFFAWGLYHSHFLSHYWSLAVEEQFYLILPVFLIFTNSTKLRVISLITVLFLITFLVRPFTHGGYFTFMYTHVRCDGLIYGCLIYYLSECNWFSSIKIKVNHANRIYWNLVMVLLVLILAAIPGLGFSINLIVPLACIIASLLVISAVFNVGILLFPPPLQIIFNYIGSRSYALYIVHFPIFALTHEIFSYIFKNSTNSLHHLTTIYMTCTLVALFLVSEFLHKYIEIPLMEKGKRISAEIINNKSIFEKIDEPLTPTISIVESN